AAPEHVSGTAVAQYLDLTAGIDFGKFIGSGQRLRDNATNVLRRPLLARFVQPQALDKQQFCRADMDLVPLHQKRQERVQSESAEKYQCAAGKYPEKAGYR